MEDVLHNSGVNPDYAKLRDALLDGYASVRAIPASVDEVRVALRSSQWRRQRRELTCDRAMLCSAAGRPGSPARHDHRIIHGTH